MSLTKAQRRSRQLNSLIANVDEYVRSFTFSLTDHDIGHQEHFHRQAVLWTEKLLKELKSERSA